jgi:tetratricopeptide (TPR) repeat protein
MVKHRPFIKAAIAVYSLYNHYNAELARALFIQGSIQEQMNEQSEAESSYERAADLYAEITHTGFGKQRALTLEDFTAIVPVSAR